MYRISLKQLSKTHSISSALQLTIHFHKQGFKIGFVVVWLKQAFVLMELQSSFSINILIRYWTGTHIQFFIFLVFEDFFKYSLDFDRNNFKDKTGTFSFFTFFMSHKFSCFDKIFSQLSNQRNDWTKQAHKTKWQLCWLDSFST